MKNSLLIYICAFLVLSLVISESYHDVVNSYLYSMVNLIIATVITVVIFIFFGVCGNKTKHSKPEQNIFKQYGPQKKPWYKKVRLSRDNVAVILLVSISIAIGSVDGSYELEKSVIPNLTITEFGTVRSLRTKMHYIDVPYKGHQYRCLDYSSKIVDIQHQMVTLSFYKGLLGFVRFDCNVYYVDRTPDFVRLEER